MRKNYVVSWTELNTMAFGTSRDYTALHNSSCSPEDLKIVSLDQERERWKNALRVLEAMDEHARISHFYMGDWINFNECGTVGCIAGHCSLDPWFHEQGFEAIVKTQLHKGREITVFERFTVADTRFFPRGNGVFYSGHSWQEAVTNVKALIERMNECTAEQDTADYWRTPWFVLSSSQS